MNTFEFYSENSAKFTSPDYDLELFNESAPLSPPTTIDDDWLDAIPIHSDSSTQESTLLSTSDNEMDTKSDIPTVPRPPPSPPTPQEEEIKPKVDILPLYEVIDFKETQLFHHIYAHQSLELHGVPKNSKERWEDYTDDTPGDIFALISYYAFFYGYDSLNDWQKDYFKLYPDAKIDQCWFCSLPKGIWCEKVAKKL